jgi:uncharacterized protein DUF6779
MLGTAVLAAAGAAVLALGAQDARLLRLGLVAALWAALLGAFAVARMRREISSGASRADELRTIYQLELEREVAARREHTLTVERELREQAQQAEQREILALRAELAAMRANLEKLMGGEPLGERVALRAESARLLPQHAHPHHFDDSPSFDDKRSTAAALGAMAKATGSRTAAGSSVRVPGGAGAGSALPTSEWPVNGRSETVLTRREEPDLDTHARPPVEPASSGDRPWNPAVPSTPVWELAPTRWDGGISHAQGNGRHGAPRRESSGPSSNGSHSNGSHNNGGGARREAQEAPVVGAQRSVNDLLAAHGEGSVPRRRRSREAG